MNTIEQFINNNREEFDSEEMKTGWEKIEPGIKQKKTKLIKRLWWAAAASIVLCISGAVYYTYIDKDRKTDMPIQSAIDLPSKELTDQVDPEYTQQMDQFAHLIEIKQTELSQNKNQQPVLYQQFLKDNNQLDSSYNFLKSKLAANPNKEILLDAMIQNLQLKLELLNRQLQIIKQSKHKKTNNEKTI
jgi:hypothetical protein